MWTTATVGMRHKSTCVLWQPLSTSCAEANNDRLGCHKNVDSNGRQIHFFCKEDWKEPAWTERHWSKLHVNSPEDHALSHGSKQQPSSQQPELKPKHVWILLFLASSSLEGLGCKLLASAKQPIQWIKSSRSNHQAISLNPKANSGKQYPCSKPERGCLELQKLWHSRSRSPYLLSEERDGSGEDSTW